MVSSYQAALDARTDLNQYESNKLLLFALQLKFQIEDIHTVAADALTDGPDDKKCDLVYVDEEAGCIVVAQGYLSQDTTKTCAPGNKASDLNTAASWLLNRLVEDLPERLQSAAQGVRAALEAKSIRSIQFWYVHNLPESGTIKNEMSTVEQTIYSSINSSFPGLDTNEMTIAAIEIGKNTLDEWYRTLETPILVSQEFKIPIDGGYSITSEDWTAFATSIPVSFLHDAFQQHKDKLFSANVRAYLGSRKSDSNINNGIKKTTEDEPNNFWVFNNGITGLVHEFQEETSNGEKFLKIKGLSIVNGAQTTGATGSLLSSPDPKAKVQARFVRCSKRDTIQKIVEYNNRQNKVEASDFRSNDAIQRRLVQEFEHITEANYLGGRRGGYEDPIRRTSNLLPSDTVGQALAAVHQDPVLAYNSKSEIWISDTLYSRYFNEQTSADHIVFVFSLLRSVEAKKHELVMKDTSALTDIETKQLRFLRYRGATFILTTAIAKCIDIFLNRAVPNLFRVSFSKDISPQMGQLLWDPIVNVAISFCDQLVPAVRDGLKSSDEASKVINTFQSLVEAIKTPNVTTFESFASQVKIHSGEVTS